MTRKPCIFLAFTIVATTACFQDPLADGADDASDSSTTETSESSSTTETGESSSTTGTGESSSTTETSESSSATETSESSSTTETGESSSTTETGDPTTSGDPICGNLEIEEDEECDDGNGDESDGCTSACTIPRTCWELHEVVGAMENGVYEVDPDGPGGDAGFPVFCDMTTAGGGWTLLERSPYGAQAISKALYTDFPVAVNDPTATRHRLDRAAMNALQDQSLEMRIDCRGSDYLLTDADNLFEGEGGPNTCANWAMISYAEAQLKGQFRTNATMCTWFPGKSEGCVGAWHIDEHAQVGYCGLPNFPWAGVAITTYAADIFAVDPITSDVLPPVHDCHKNNGARWVMVR